MNLISGKVYPNWGSREKLGWFCGSDLVDLDGSWRLPLWLMMFQPGWWISWRQLETTRKVHGKAQRYQRSWFQGLQGLIWGLWGVSPLKCPRLSIPHMPVPKVWWWIMMLHLGCGVPPVVPDLTWHKKGTWLSRFWHGSPETSSSQFKSSYWIPV